METNEELIKEARDMALYARATRHGAVSHADMIDKLADALEAATEPEWEYRVATGPVIRNFASPEQVTRALVHGHKVFKRKVRQESGPWLPVEGESA